MSSEGLSNQGRPIDEILEHVTSLDLKAAATAARTEVGRHPEEATCECPAIEVLAVLYERGYKLVKAGG